MINSMETVKEEVVETTKITKITISKDTWLTSDCITIGEIINILQKFDKSAVLVQGSCGMVGTQFVIPVPGLRFEFQEDENGLYCAPNFTPKKIIYISKLSYDEH